MVLEYRNVFGAVVLKENQEHLVVPESLIAAYEEAWERKRSNPEIYRKLEDFVDLMDGISQGEVTVNELPVNVSSLYHIADPTDEAIKEIESYTREKFLEDFGKYEGYRMPSLLEIRMDGSGWIYEIFKEPVFQVQSYVFIEDGVLSNSAAPLVFTDGKWKMLALRY